MKRNNAKLTAYVFLISFIFYISLTNGTFWERDGQTVFYVTKNIVETQNFNIPCYQESISYKNSCYSKYGLFSSFAVIPFYFLDKLMNFLNISYFPLGFFASLTNSFITALLVSLFYLFLIKFNFSAKTSLFAAFVFGAITYLPAYAKTLFTEPLTTLLIFLSLYFILFKEKSNSNSLSIGLLLGLSLLTKVSTVFFIPAIVYALFVKRYNFTNIFFISTPISLCLLIFLFYNFLRFDNPFDTGYRNESFSYPLLDGLFLFILSPGKSLFLYQPLIIFSIFGFKNFYKHQKQSFITLLILTLTIFLIFSTYHSPTGDLTWGSRYLYPTLPFFVSCMIFGLSNLKSRFLKKTFIITLVLSAFIQFSSVYLSYHRYFSFLHQKLGDQFTNLSYIVPKYSPLIGQWELILKTGNASDGFFTCKYAFNEYPTCDKDYLLAPPDIFFARTKTGAVFLLILFFIEIYLVTKLLKNVTVYESTRA